MMKRVLVFVAALAIVSSTTLAAPSLVSVGVLDANSPFSDVKALTVGADGTIYAVGGSTSPTLAVNTPHVWSSTGGIMELPNPSGIASDARGVSLITQDTLGNAPLIAISGQVGNIARGYTAPLATPAGGSWIWANSDYSMGAYNTSRTDPNRTDGRTQLAGSNTKNSRGARARFYPDPGAAEYPGTGTTNMQSISQSGVPIGQDRGGVGGQRRAVYGNSANNPPTAIPGGNLERSEGYGISADGQWMSGLDYQGSLVQGFKWKIGDAAMTLLGWYANDTNTVAYAINNLGIAVGRTFNSTDSDRACIWDDTGTWDNSGQTMLVKDLLDAAGVDTSAWTKLTRVTTISDDGMTVGGYGVWAEDGSTRGFIATIPEPATLSLLVLGGLALIRRRR